MTLSTPQALTTEDSQMNDDNRTLPISKDPDTFEYAWDTGGRDGGQQLTEPTVDVRSGPGSGQRRAYEL